MLSENSADLNAASNHYNEPVITRDQSLPFLYQIILLEIFFFDKIVSFILIAMQHAYIYTSIHKKRTKVLSINY